MKRVIASFLLSGFFFGAGAQITIVPVKLTPSKIPAEIKFKGKFLEGYQWKDKLGENLLITSELGPYRDTIHGLNEEDITKELFAYHFYKKDSGWKLLWR